MELILYQNEHCPYSERIRRVLGEKGLLHERVEVRWNELADMERLTSSRMLPTLVADGETINDSPVIASYLNQLNENRNLFPQAYAKSINEWHLEANTLLKASDSLGIPLLAEHLRDFNEREAFLAMENATESWAELTQQKIQHWRSVNDLWRKVDAALSGRDYLVGNALTWADLSMYGAVFWVAQWRGYGVPEPLHNLTTWYARIRTTGQYREQEIFLGALRARRLRDDNIYDQARYSDPASDSRRDDMY